MAEETKKFVHKYLDPGSRLGEVLFGLIMVLSVTLSAELVSGRRRASALELLVAAVGCNVAWGAIDAAMYIMNGITIRSGRAQLMRAVKGAANVDAALAIIRAKVEPEIESLTLPAAREAIYQSMFECLKHGSEPAIKITREDVYGGISCFWLVFLSCLPAATPFLVFSDPIHALRVSNFLLLVMLFAVGFKWAGYAGTNRLIFGLAMVAVGLALVGIAMLFGG